ncbi:MAG: type II toxin-antitoxin system RelE/ParE family toxin [Bacillota bacterium]
MYRVLWTSAAERQMGKLPRQVAAALVAAAESLCDNPRPHGAVKLVGRDEWRLREGDYRMIYTVDDARREVTIQVVGHRKDVYDL